jgi:hypothetical protein
MFCAQLNVVQIERRNVINNLKVIDIIVKDVSTYLPSFHRYYKLMYVPPSGVHLHTNNMVPLP